MRNTCRLAVTGKQRSKVSWEMPKASTYKGSILLAVPMIKPNLIKSPTKCYVLIDTDFAFYLFVGDRTDS